MHIVPQVEDSGALGELSFREDGSRQGYVIGVYGLSTSGLVQVWRRLIMYTWFNYCCRRKWIDVT